MPRKTLALIIGLVIVTVVLFVIALRTNNENTQVTQKAQPTQAPAAAEPTSVAHSVLTLAPNPITVAPRKQGEVDVVIDTSDNAVTAVQLELAYDPNIISNVKVTAGQLFPNSVVLYNDNDTQAGRYTFAIGIPPGRDPIQGSGQVAKITFTAKGTLGQQSQLALLPETLVSARGVATSVLKNSSGTLVIIGNDGSGSTPAGTTVQTTIPVTR